MSAPVSPRTDPVRCAGRTIFSGRSLHRLVVGIVSEVTEVPARDIAVSLGDRSGLLYAAVSLPLVLVPGVGEALPQRSAVARRAVIDGMATITGRQVGNVDLRFRTVSQLNRRVV